LYITSTYI